MKLSKLEFALPLTACVGWAAMHPSVSGGLNGLALGVMLLLSQIITRASLSLPLFSRSGAIIPLLLGPALAAILSGIILLAFLTLFNQAHAGFANANPQLNAQTADTPQPPLPTEEEIKAIWGMLNTELDKRDLSNPHDRVNFMGAMVECLQVHNQESGDLTPVIMEELGKCADEKVSNRPTTLKPKAE